MIQKRLFSTTISTQQEYSIVKWNQTQMIISTWDMINVDKQNSTTDFNNT